MLHSRSFRLSSRWRRARSRFSQASLPWLLCLLSGLLAGYPGEALAERYNLLKYLPADGISQSQVTSILQDSDGYLWLGTLNGGLNRFDGQTFRVYRWPDGLASAHIRGLLEVDRHLYVGTRHGLFQRTGDRFKAILPASGQQLDIYYLSGSPGGELEVATDKGLFVLDASGLQAHPAAHLLPEGAVWEAHAEQPGELWVFGESWLGVLKDGSYSGIEVPAGLELRNLVADPGGGAWVGTRHGLFHTRDQHLEPINKRHPALEQAITSLYLDGSRTLWVGTRRGVVALKDNIAQFIGPENGFPMVQVRAIHQDREGNIFFGTDGEGLLQLPRQPFTTYIIPGLDDYAPFASVEDQSGRRWIATIGEGLWVIDGDRATQLGDESGLTSPDCSALLTNPDGSLWVGTNKGLFEVRQKDRGFKATQVSTVGRSSVNALVADKQRRYVSTETGLWVNEGQTWKRYGIEEGLPSIELYGIRISHAGGLWVGTHDTGAFLFDPYKGSVLQHVRLEDGLPSRTVISIWEDTDGTVWFGTDQGLVHKTAHGLEVITSRNGLPDDTINFITTGPDDGTLWVGTNRGIAARIDEAWRTYTHRQGLANDETNTNAAFWDGQGRLWAGTSHGFAILRSTPPPVNPVPPIVHIEGAWEHDRALSLDENPTFPYNENKLRLKFVGLSYTDPTRVRYRYRLGGLEDGWTETDLREVRYPSLPPGAYLFEVSASNNDGRWTGDPARYSFSILPPFWETWWFRTLQVLAIFVSGLLVYAIRAHRLQQQKRRLEELVVKRTRELAAEKEKSERLLLNILPAPIADELKERGVATTRLYPDVTILFTDFQGFTRMSAAISPERLVEELNDVFAVFDDICRAHRLEKLKTIGDAFMAAGGLPVENATHPIDAVEAALEMQEFLKDRAQDPDKIPFQLRIGLHTGPVVAGVIGKWKFAYDIWGDAVNTASRMESSGAAGEINLSRATWERIQVHFDCEARGRVLAKGKGELEMFFVRSRRHAA